MSLRQLLPWTELFQGFQVALDPRKLLLAAAGIVVMFCGWWLLAVIFMSTASRKDWSADFKNRDLDPNLPKEKAELKRWAKLIAEAGITAAD